MKTTRISADAFTLEFESEEELRSEHRTNLSMGGARLPTQEQLVLHSRLVLTLRGIGGGEVTVNATVVAPLPDGVALAIEGDPDALLEKLLADLTPATTSEPDAETDDDASSVTKQTTWDRIRGLQRNEKLFLAPKAGPSERALLVQDNDPQVLFYLLKNPRLTMDEVLRIAKSTYLTFQIAELIMKSGQWMGNPDVRLALVQNSKTPPAFALRILPTLPESDVRGIARNATNMALKQAAIRRLQDKK